MNTYRIEGNSVRIFLTQGQSTLIDLEDFSKVSEYKWFAHQNARRVFYAVANIDKGEKRTTIRLHRFIMNPCLDQVVDHINHNGLDNRKSNLRCVSNAENISNRRGPNKNNKLGIRGVHLTNEKGRLYYKHVIKINGKRISKHFPATPEGLEAAKKVSKSYEGVLY